MKNQEKNTEYKPGCQVLGISGSPRRGGNSDLLCNTILEGAAGEGAVVRSVNLSEIDISGCIGCERCRQDKICTGINDGMTLLYDTIISSRGLILVSPTHNYNITSWMKAFIDRLYCFYDFENPRPGPWSSRLQNQGRKAVVAAVCEQDRAEDMGYTLEGMKNPLAALGYDVIAEYPVLHTFRKSGIKDAPEILEGAFALGRRLASSIDS